MKVIIEPEAQDIINEIAELIDGINTPGAGDRWTDRILDFIAEYAQPKAKYALCQNKQLAESHYSCITFNNWVIVFKTSAAAFVVYKVIHGSLL